VKLRGSATRTDALHRSSVEAGLVEDATPNVHLDVLDAGREAAFKERLEQILCHACRGAGLRQQGMGI